MKTPEEWTGELVFSDSTQEEREEFIAKIQADALASKDFPETHKQGHVSIENLEMVKTMDLHDVDFGVQISADGRVWCCVNGIAFIRFRPHRERLTQTKNNKKQLKLTLKDKQNEPRKPTANSRQT